MQKSLENFSTALLVLASLRGRGVEDPFPEKLLKERPHYEHFLRAVELVSGRAVNRFEDTHSESSFCATNVQEGEWCYDFLDLKGATVSLYAHANDDHDTPRLTQLHLKFKTPHDNKLNTKFVYFTKDRGILAIEEMMLDGVMVEGVLDKDLAMERLMWFLQ